MRKGAASDRRRWRNDITFTFHSLGQAAPDVVSIPSKRFPPQNPDAALPNRPRLAIVVVTAVKRLLARTAEMATASSQIPATPLRSRSKPSMFLPGCIIVKTIRLSESV